MSARWHPHWLQSPLQRLLVCRQQINLTYLLQYAHRVDYACIEFRQLPNCTILIESTSTRPKRAVSAVVEVPLLPFTVLLVRLMLVVMIMV